jgi:hypothetical protein
MSVGDDRRCAVPLCWRRCGAVVVGRRANGRRVAAFVCNEHTQHLQVQIIRHGGQVLDVKWRSP